MCYFLVELHEFLKYSQYKSFVIDLWFANIFSHFVLSFHSFNSTFYLWMGFVYVCNTPANKDIPTELSLRM